MANHVGQRPPQQVHQNRIGKFPAARLTRIPAAGEHVAVSFEGIFLAVQGQAATNRFRHRMEQRQQIVLIWGFTAGFVSALQMLVSRAQRYGVEFIGLAGYLDAGQARK